MQEIDLSGIPKEIDLSGIPEDKPIDLSGIPSEGAVDLSGIPSRSLTAEDIPDIVAQIRNAIIAPPPQGPEFTPQQMALEAPATFNDPRLDRSDTASLTKNFVPMSQPEAPLPDNTTASGFYTPPAQRPEPSMRAAGPQDGPQIRPYGTQDVGMLRRTGRDIGAAVGTMTTGTGQVLKMAGKGYENLGLETVGKYLEKTGQAVAGQGRDLTAKMQMENPTAFDALVQGVASTGTFFIPGLGVSKVGQALSFAPKIASAFGIAASSLMESSIEAGLAREEAINSGLTEEAADHIASKVFMANVPITALGNKLGIFGKAKSIPGKFAQAYLAEGGQEALQKVASNVPSGKEAMAGTAQDFLIGGLAGGLIGAVSGQGITPEQEQGPRIPGWAKASPQKAQERVLNPEQIKGLQNRLDALNAKIDGTKTVDKNGRVVVVGREAASTDEIKERTRIQKFLSTVSEQPKTTPTAQAEGVAGPTEFDAKKMNETLEQGVKKASEAETISTPEQVGEKFGFNVEIDPQADIYGSEWSSGGKKLVVGSDTTPSKYFSADWTKGGGKDFVSSADIPNNVKSAYHEAAHGLFSKNPEKGHIAINELKKLGVPSEQSFESLVDMGGLYLSEPSAITNPSVKKILDNWIGEYAQKPVAGPQGAGQEVASPEGQGAGVHLRDASQNGVEAAKGEVAPSAPTEPPPPTPPTAEGVPPDSPEPPQTGPFAPKWDKGERREFSFDPNSTPTEGRFRLVDPSTLTDMRRHKTKMPGISYNIGKDANGKEVISSIRFDKRKVTAEQAQKFWQDNAKNFEFGQEATPPDAEIGTPERTKYFVSKISRGLAEVQKLRAEQNMMYSAEWKERFGNATQAYVLAGGGIEGHKAALSKLKGPLEKKTFEAMNKIMTPQDVDEMVRMIYASPNLKYIGDMMSAANGLKDMLHGVVIQDAQIAKLEKVFGRDLTNALKAQRSGLRQAYDMGLEIANIPRSLMASMDLSAPFRQGAWFVSRKEFWDAWAPMLKAAWSESDFNAIQQEIESRPLYSLMRKAKLDITGLSHAADREETFAAPLIERPLKVGGRDINLPGRIVRGSGRAYVAFLNKLRADVFDSMLKSAEKGGHPPSMELIKKIAAYINTATGRGPVGQHGEVAKALNAVLFSPRLMASRIDLMTKPLQLHTFYNKDNAFIRQQYWRDMKGFLKFGGALMFLASLAGGEVGDDPRSSDFGKVKFGNTRLDVWGGFQQYVRMLGQIYSNAYVSSITGKVSTLGEGYKPISKWDIASRQLQSKFSPIMSFITAMMKQQDWQGEPVKFWNEVGSRLLPMAATDIVTVAMEDPSLLPISALGVVGMGSQTYGGESKVDYEKMARGMAFQDIFATMKNVKSVEAKKTLRLAAKRAYPTAKKKIEEMGGDITNIKKMRDELEYWKSIGY